MRVLITGDRKYADGQCVERVLRRLIEDHGMETEIVQGGARGADTLAHRFALGLGLTSISVPARWDKYGRASGPIRNRKMLQDWKPDLVIYFHDNLQKSRGTKDLVNRARRLGIPVDNGIDRDRARGHAEEH